MTLMLVTAGRLLGCRTSRRWRRCPSWRLMLLVRVPTASWLLRTNRGGSLRGGCGRGWRHHVTLMRVPGSRGCRFRLTVSGVAAAWLRLVSLMISRGRHPVLSSGSRAGGPPA